MGCPESDQGEGEDKNDAQSGTAKDERKRDLRQGSHAQ